MKPSKARRKRGRALGQIQAAARERQEAWAETEQKDLTEALTRKLDDLFGEFRVERPDEGTRFSGHSASYVKARKR